MAPPGSSTSLALVPARADLPAGGETGVRLSTGSAAAVHETLLGRGVEVGDC